MTRHTLIRVPVTGPTVTSLAESWTIDLCARGRSEHTIASYRETLRQFDAFLTRHRLPPEAMAVTRDDVRGFVTHLLGDRSSGTAATRFAALHAFFNWALSEGEIVTSPMASMEPPTRREVPPAVLMDDEVMRLFRTCTGSGFRDRRDLAILRLLFDTGMRRNEVGTLTVDAVDVAGRLATVIGKGNRVRRVSFGGKAARALDRYLRVRRAHPYADRQAFWLSQMGAMDGRSIAAVVVERSRQAGMVVHPHQFRHTYAHNQLRHGMQEGDLMRQAGWRSSGMLRRYGAQMADDRSREAYLRIGAPGDRL
jgi:site-specific recombinase XerD